MAILLDFLFFFCFCLIVELMCPRDYIIVYTSRKQLLYFHSVHKRETKIAYVLKFVTIYMTYFTSCRRNVINGARRLGFNEFELIV